MDGLDGEDGTGTVFRDVIFLALAGFMAVVMMLLPHLNPPTRAEADIASPGNVIVEISWPDEIDADVDLWVEAPGDRPVGYSNKGGTVFNLLRDDLGFVRDVGQINYEVSYSRGIPAGEYTVNLHLYKAANDNLPLPVITTVSVKPDPGKDASRVLYKTFELMRVDQELTAFRFTIDEGGNVLRDSVHDLPRHLREQRG